MNTPWGKADWIDKLEHGILSVSTPSHGGFLVPEQYAQEHFSPEALSIANDYCGYVPQGFLAYEEDCAAYAVLMEVPEIAERYNINPEDAKSQFFSIYKSRLERI